MFLKISANLSSLFFSFSSLVPSKIFFDECILMGKHVEFSGRLEWRKSKQTLCTSGKVRRMTGKRWEEKVGESMFGKRGIGKMRKSQDDFENPHLIN